MIRYVLVVLLTVTIVGMTMPAIDDVAADRSEAVVRGEITEIEAAAVSLSEHEAVPPDGERRSSARRVLEVEFPERSLTARSLRVLRIEPNREHGFSTVTYAVGERPAEHLRIGSVVVGADNGTVELGGSGIRTLVLRAVRDGAGNRVVELRRA